MPIFIWEPDAFEKLVEVEGPDYPYNQRNFGGVSFRAFKQTWERRIAEDSLLRNLEVGMDNNGNGAMYGLGGWHRYVVLYTGEILFTARMCNSCRGGPSVHVSLARKVGFRIFPDDLLSART